MNEARGFGSFAYSLLFDGRHFFLSSDEEGERNVDNFVLCSLVHHACSPLLQGFLHEEELCKVALTLHFSLDVVSVRTERWSLSLELNCWQNSDASFLTMQICQVCVNDTRKCALV